MTASTLDRHVGLALAVATAVSTGLLAAGVAAMILGGVQPLEGPRPALDLERLGADVTAFRTDGWLWLGLIAVVLTPAIRVGASLVWLAAVREGRQAAIALAVLIVMVLSVVLGYRG